MAKTEINELLKAGVHFGHLTRKWNPNMAPFIHMERNGIHIISLYKTIAKLEMALRGFNIAISDQLEPDMVLEDEEQTTESEE